jgi:uncharacterized protein HemX
VSPRRLIRYNGKLLAAAMIAAVVVLIGAGGFAIWQGNRAAEREAEQEAQRAEEARIALCQAQNDSRKALSDILVLARSLGTDEPQTPRQARRVQQFYDRAFELVSPLNCREVAAG